MTKNSGVIAINKPIDWTSFDVVNKIKHLVRPLKVGHLGTLDPMATGVLLVTIGKATKLFDLMQEKTKRYVATFKFGETTDTLDISGNIIERCDYLPTIEEIKNVVPMFVGEIDQIPPKYSAKSINGVRAYTLARQNIDFELKSKKVTIHSIKIISYSNNELILDIVCGSGTYIRSIGRDIAKSVNSLAVMSKLERVEIDRFSIENCYNIDSLDKDTIMDKMMTLNEILDYPILDVNDDLRKKLLNGQTKIIDKPDGVYKLCQGEDLLALVKIEKNHAKMSLFLA